MASPTAYTETSLALYMVNVAGEVVTILGWEAMSLPVTEAVNEAVLAYGVTDITTVTEPADIRSLRAVARREIWRAIVGALTSFHDYSAPDGQSIRESQLQDQAEKALALAEADCVALGVDAGGYVVSSERVRYGTHRRPDEFEMPRGWEYWR
jgi:hypothetical protein